MKNRICLDIRVCQKASRFTGVGIYAFHLSQKLLEVESEAGFEFWFLVLKGKTLPWQIPTDRLIKVWRPPKPESFQEIYDIIDVRFRLKLKKINLIHSLVPGFIVPGKRLGVVVTVHDIIPSIMPEENQNSNFIKWIYQKKMSCACKANHILVNSNFTGNDLVNLYKIPKDGVTTAYLGSQFASPDRQMVKNLESCALDRSYLLYLGGFNYRKNVKAILSAFAKIMEEFPETNLLIVGKPAKLQEKELLNYCRELSFHKRVKWLGFIPDKDLPNLYVWCAAFIYPSLYEGFGLPVLEAMQFGAPVITSNTSSIPEIAGNAAIQINPDSIQEIAGAIRLVLDNKEVANEMRNKGKIQAQKFSWDRCAKETIGVYRKVINK